MKNHERIVVLTFKMMRKRIGGIFVSKMSQGSAPALYKVFNLK